MTFPEPQVYIPPPVTATIYIEKTVLQPASTGADTTFQAALFDGQENRIGDAVSVSEGNPASMTLSVKQELGIGNEPKTFYLQETGPAPESWTYDQTAYPVTICPDGTVFNGVLPDAEPNDEAHPIVLTNIYAPTADLTIINSGDDGPEGTRFTYCVTIGGVIQESFRLGSGECRTFAAVPVGTSYRVAEEPDERYETTGSGTMGVIDVGGNTAGFSHVFITYKLTITSRVLTDEPLGEKCYEYILRLGDDYGVLPPASAQYDAANDAYRFELAGGDSLTFQHIPRLSEYTVTQTPDPEAGGNYQIRVKEDADSEPVNAAAYSSRISGNRNITFTNQYLRPSQLSISKAVIKGIEVPGYQYGFLIELWTRDDDAIVPFIDKQGLLPQWLSITDTPGTYAFTLRAGQSAALSDLPIGLHYLITEPEEGSGGAKDTVIAVNGAAAQDAQGIISHDTDGDDAAVVVFSNDFSVETGRLTVENPIDDPHWKYAGQAFSYEATFTEPVAAEPYCVPVETDEGYLYAFSLEAGEKTAFTGLHEGTAYKVREIDTGGADEVSVSGGEMHDQTGISVSGVMKRSGFNVLDEGLQFTHRYNPYVLSMQLSKSVQENQIYAGEAARYTLELHNTGEYRASRVYLMDTLFSGLEKDRISVSITSGANGETSALGYGGDYDFAVFASQSLGGQTVPDGVYLVLNEAASFMPGDRLTVSYEITCLLPGQYVSSASAICLFAPLEEMRQSEADHTVTILKRPVVQTDKYTVTVAYYEEKTNSEIRKANTLTNLVCGQPFNIESCGFVYDALGDYRLSGASAAYSGTIGGSDVLIFLYYKKSIPGDGGAMETPGQAETEESQGGPQTPDMPQSESAQDDVTSEESVPDSKIPAALPDTGGIAAGWPVLIGAVSILTGVILSVNRRKGRRKGQ